MTEAEKKEMSDFLQGSLIDFAVNVFKTHLTSKVPEFHLEMYKLLESEKRLVIAAPRGFAKSTLASVIYPAWLGLYAKATDICIISASESLAIELLRKIKTEFETNPIIRDLYGDIRSPKWTESHIILKHGVNIRAKGAGGQIRGFRPDTLILDDIETDESVESEEQRKKLKDWLFRACINTLLPNGQLVVVGTIIHPLSLLSDLLETPNGWTKKKLKAYTDGIEDEEHALWKTARPHVWLQARKKEIGSFAFSTEYMNDPMKDESAVIKDSQIRYWETLPSQFNAVIAVDPAYSEEERSDFKVAALILCDSQQNRYLVDYIRTHDPIGEFIDAILNMYERNKGTVTGIGIPNAGTEKMFYQSVLKRAEERKIYAPFVELKNAFTTQGGHTVRLKKHRIAAALQPIFEQGKYYIGKDHYEAREELLTIGSSRWDDIVDCLAYAETILQPYYEEKNVPTVDRYGYPVEKETIGENYGY